MNEKTIQVVGEERCTGCGACFNRCPVGAIQMKPGSEGFLSPVVDENNCISCGLCQSVCPEVKINSRSFDIEKEKECYAFYAEKSVRHISSSGGAFTVLANKILDLNGYVCGARYSNDYKEVYHTIIHKAEDLSVLRGSKYVQSNTKEVYKEIKSLLEDNQWVLFSGCPCQCAGLHSYLKRSYDKLVTVDIVCHGVPSPLVYKVYLHELCQGRKLKKFDFREKDYWGWGTASSAWFTNGEIYRKDCFKDFYWKAFLEGLSTRKSCGTCHYANPYTRGGDITIGDFWGIKELLPNLDAKDGISMVVINTLTGKSFFKSIINSGIHQVTAANTEEQGSSWYIEKVDFGKAIELGKKRNGQFVSPRDSHWARKRFFELLPQKGFLSAYDAAVNSKYDVGIIGWWNNLNYGGILTYFALNRVLQSMGLSVLMIRHIRWPSEEKPSMDSIAYRFAQKYYYISKNYPKSNLSVLNKHCKAYISGSDQLFNPYLWDYSGKEYFLNFADISNNMISYASSFGNDYKTNNAHHLDMSYWLHRFDSLSVREEYAVDICERAFGIDAKLVADPVFLCDVENYRTLAKSSGLKKEYPYLLNFILDPSVSKRDAILQLSSVLDLDYINLLNATDIEKNVRTLNLKNTKPGIDVEEWLFYYMNADFVFTDSFHGTCFAIIFQKPFIAIANKSRGEKRFESILTIAGLKDRLIYSLEEIKSRPDLLLPIDYEQVYRRLKPFIHESYDWLYNAIFKRPDPAKNIFKLLDYQLKKQVSDKGETNG